MENILLLTVILICFWCWKCVTTSHKLPPGPIGIPILGYLPFLSTKLHVNFRNLKQKHGEIFSFYVGQKLVVVLSSFKLIKEAFLKQGNIVFGRPQMLFRIPPEFKNAKGFAFNSEKSWVEIKNLVTNYIKKFRSDGKGELMIKDEIMHFLKEIKKLDEKPANIYELISISISNIMWVFLFGERNDYNDKKFQDMLKVVEKHVSKIHFVGIEIVFPWIYKIPFIQKWIRPFVAIDTYRKMHKYFDVKLKEMERKLSSENSESINFTFEWFKEQKKTKILSDNVLLISVIIDIVMAGTDTSSNFIYWLILFMAEYPKVQEKVQQEIDDVVSENRTPSLADMKYMRYTNAVIMEVYRIVSIVPLVPHNNMQDITLEGYEILEGSMIIANYWEVNHDRDIFPNPDLFLPERFLENGKINNFQELTPFSYGKRQCPGELYARMLIFLYFTSLLQNFTFKKYIKEKLELDYKVMPIIFPRKQKVYVTART